MYPVRHCRADVLIYFHSMFDLEKMDLTFAIQTFWRVLLKKDFK